MTYHATKRRSSVSPKALHKRASGKEGEEDFHIRVATSLTKMNLPHFADPFSSAPFTKFGMPQRLISRLMMWAYRRGYNKSYPDFRVFVPKRNYSGLQMELKASHKDPFYKGRPKLKAGSHLLDQARVLSKLNSQGNLALFVVGWKDYERLITWYMGDDTYHPVFEQIEPVEYKCKYTGAKVPLKLNVKKIVGWKK